MPKEDSFIEVQKRRKENQLKSARRYVLKRDYNITLEDYETLLKNQNFSCAICGNSSAGTRHKNNTFCVDHDHKTGQVRGLLCQSCNTLVVPAVEYYSNRLDATRKYLEVSKKLAVDVDKIPGQTITDNIRS